MWLWLVQNVKLNSATTCTHQWYKKGLKKKIGYDVIEKQSQKHAVHRTYRENSAVMWLMAQPQSPICFLFVVIK